MGSGDVGMSYYIKHDGIIYVSQGVNKATKIQALRDEKDACQARIVALNAEIDELQAL
jgi:hypothetical protein